MEFFNKQDTPQEILKRLEKELLRGVHDGKHPFRYVYLSTASDNTPSGRMVVLRGYDAERNFWIYTDSRTQKVRQLKENPMAHLVFYHQRKKLQIRVSGNVQLLNKANLEEDLGKKTDDYLRKDYTSTLAPGTPVDDPERAHSWEAEHSYFLAIKLMASSIEALQLDRSGHLRINFKFLNGEVIPNWLVP